MIVLGLTGSVGMGKSTTARFFAEEGIPVYSADAVVHTLYHQKPVVSEIEAVFPEVVENAAINHEKLAAMVFGRPEALRRLEAIVHPHVRKAETEFLHRACKQGHRIAVLDIPLLYETGGQARVDRVVVVSAPSAIQRKRVLSRSGMTEKKFAAILARQMPDEEKRRHADFIIDTGKDLDALHEDVRSVIRRLLAA
jgi:dephospho-CoA kinase